MDTAGAHNLVVWTQQGLLIWLRGHRRGLRFGCVDTEGAYDLVVWTQQGLTIGCVDTAGALLRGRVKMNWRKARVKLN